MIHSNYRVCFSFVLSPKQSFEHLCWASCLPRPIPCLRTLHVYRCHTGPPQFIWGGVSEYGASNDFLFPSRFVYQALWGPGIGWAATGWGNGDPICRWKGNLWDATYWTPEVSCPSQEEAVKTLESKSTGTSLYDPRFHKLHHWARTLLQDGPLPFRWWFLFYYDGRGWFKARLLPHPVPGFVQILPYTSPGFAKSAVQPRLGAIRFAPASPLLKSPHWLPFWGGGDVHIHMCWFSNKSYLVRLLTFWRTQYGSTAQVDLYAPPLRFCWSFPISGSTTWVGRYSLCWLPHPGTPYLFTCVLQQLLRVSGIQKRPGSSLNGCFWARKALRCTSSL